MWKLVELLETYFTCLVGADAYVLQPGSQGLAPQFDEMEVSLVKQYYIQYFKILKVSPYCLNYMYCFSLSL